MPAESNSLDHFAIYFRSVVPGWGSGGNALIDERLVAKAIQEMDRTRSAHRESVDNLPFNG